MTQPAWMAPAWAELGQRERPGSADNPRIIAYYADAGHPGVRHDEVAWCAAFAGACLERSAVASTRSLMARSYLAWGQPLDEPRLGAIAVLSRGSDPASGHVGFWLGESGENVLILGGNQSDAVTVAAYSKSRLIGLRWPLSANTMPPQAGLHVRVGNADTFDRALAHVLRMEGGYTNDPHDPGGPTNRGITLATFARHMREELDAANRESLVERLRRIDDATVRAIYSACYWTPSRAAELPAPLALMHFDAAVNHGVAGAARLLQIALEVDVDGEIGPITLAAARRWRSDHALAAYAAARRKRYRALPHFWRFGRGWLARVDRTLAAARALPPTPASQSKPQPGEPDMSDDREFLPQPDVKWWGNSITVWGTLLTGVTTVLPVIGPLLGINITGELARQLGDQVVMVAQAVGGLVGTLMTLYGRSRATTRLERREFRVQL